MLKTNELSLPCKWYTTIPEMFKQSKSKRYTICVNLYDISRNKWKWTTEKKGEQQAFNEDQLLGLDHWGWFLCFGISLFWIIVIGPLRLIFIFWNIIMRKLRGSQHHCHFLSLIIKFCDYWIIEVAFNFLECHYAQVERPSTPLPFPFLDD